MINATVHWLFPREDSLETIRGSHLASLRLRAGIAGSAVRREGGSVTFGEWLPRSPNIVVVPKIGSDNIQIRSHKWIELIDEAKSTGAKIVIDYTDHHLGFDSPMREFYSNALTRTDVIVVPSYTMQRNLPPHLTHLSIVIPDAIEYECIKPRFRVIHVPRLLWFGHPSNLPYLFEFTQKVNIKSCCELIITTSTDGLNWIKENYLSLSLPKVHLVEWSVEALPDLARQSDLALLPTGLNDARKRGASNNRLVTSFALGLPVLAQTLESYAEFHRFYTDIDTDDIFGVICKPSSQHEKVLASQAQIVPLYAVPHIAKQWISLFLTMMNNSS